MVFVAGVNAMEIKRARLLRNRLPFVTSRNAGHHGHLPAMSKNGWRHRVSDISIAELFRDARVIGQSGPGLPPSVDG